MSHLADNLPVGVKLDQSGQWFQFVVTWEGVDVVIAATKTGGLRDDLARAKQEAADAAAAAPPPAPEPAPAPVAEA